MNVSDLLLQRRRRHRHCLRLGMDAPFDADEAEVGNVPDVGEDGEGEGEEAVGDGDDVVDVLLLNEDLTAGVARVLEIC
jgi:hypothetical protein